MTGEGARTLLDLGGPSPQGQGMTHQRQRARFRRRRKLAEAHALVGPPRRHGRTAPIFHHPLLRAAPRHEPAPARRRVRHPHLAGTLRNVLQCRHGRHVVERRRSDEEPTVTVRQGPHHWQIAGQGQPVLEAELAVEVRDAHDQLDQVAPPGRLTVEPRHQRPHEPTALVLAVGGHQLDLTGR